MGNKFQNEYNPDIISPPGETLSDTLDEVNMPQTELAKQMGCAVEFVYAIIQGNAVITTDIASQLEQILHVPASFWLMREHLYRESLMKQQTNQHDTRKRRLS